MSKNTNTDPGVLNFSKIRTSSDRLNFGEDDLENLAIYYWVLPYPMERYSKVLVTFDINPFKEYENIPRNSRVTFFKEGKSVLKVLSKTIKNGETSAEHLLVIPVSKLKEYDEVRLELLIEKFNDDGLGLSNLKLYLGEEGLG